MLDKKTVLTEKNINRLESAETTSEKVDIIDSILDEHDVSDSVENFDIVVAWFAEQR